MNKAGRRSKDDDPMRSHYWLRLKERRLVAGVSQEVLGRMSRIPKLSILHWEGGKVEPSLQMLVQLVVGLGLTGLDDLVTIDRDAIKEEIAREALLKSKGQKKTPVIARPPADAAVPELQPAIPSAEPMIGAAAVITETFVNPVGDMMKKAETEGETAK